MTTVFIPVVDYELSHVGLEDEINLAWKLWNSHYEYSHVKIAICNKPL